MPLEDWSVEIFDVAPRANAQKNPYTGLPIDPDGLTMSLFTMRLTHVPTGKVLERADLHSSPTKESLIAYARGVIEVAEKNMAAQKSGTVPSPLKGLLNVTAPVSVDGRTQGQKDLEAFNQLHGQIAQTEAQAQALKLASPEKGADLDASLEALKARRDALAPSAADALIDIMSKSTVDAIAEPSALDKA